MADLTKEVGESNQLVAETTKKKIGRPRKTEIEARKKPGKVGRPPGDATAINEFKARILTSPRSKKVLDSIMNAALDDDHKNQAAAWKILTDRLIPLSYFEKDKTGGGKSAITINITGISEVSTSEEIEAEYEEI